MPILPSPGLAAQGQHPRPSPILERLLGNQFFWKIKIEIRDQHSAILLPVPACKMGFSAQARPLQRIIQLCALSFQCGRSASAAGAVTARAQLTTTCENGSGTRKRSQERIIQARSGSR